MIIREIDLSLLDIGQAQVRTDLSSGIDELAASIRVQGLIHPIHVCETASDRFEIIAGQRRFLAHQLLGKKTIQAVVVPRDQLTDVQRVALSLTENMIRRDMTQRELIDACTKLYRQYGSMKIVAEETGLSADKVSQYVKYDQLIGELKDLVDNQGLDMQVALQAQRAAQADNGEVDEEAAVKFAQELQPMSGAQRKNFIKTVSESATDSIEERIERGRKQPILKQVVITLGEELLKQLQNYARNEGTTQDEAAAALIEDGLARRGI